MFPRLNGWGLIEATMMFRVTPSRVVFPRLNGWGLIEALEHGRQARRMPCFPA